MNAPPRIWPILLATLVGTAILVTLGVWQVQRLHWKEALLAQLAANAAAAPVDLATAAGLAAKGLDPEFVRVKFTGTYRHEGWKKMISTYDGGQGWTIITPAASADGWAVIVDRGRIPGQRHRRFRKARRRSGDRGRHPHLQAGAGPCSTPRTMPQPISGTGGTCPPCWRRAAFRRVSSRFPMWCSFCHRAPRNSRGRRQPQANLANNHLGYAITWFGLALTLLGVAGFYIYDLRKRRSSGT